MDWQIIFVSGSFLAMLGGVLKIAHGFRKDLDENVKLMFRRFDDHKEATDQKMIWQTSENDRKYMRSDNCGLINGGYAKEISGVKEHLKELNRKIDILLEERRVSAH